MKKQLFFLFVPLVIWVTSCKVYHPESGSSFKKTTSYACKTKPKSVALFFRNDSLYFRYKTLGTVQAFGKDGGDEQEIRDRLKYSAYQNCANAVIAITTETVTRNYGGEFRSGSKTYVSKIYKGIAVKMEADSTGAGKLQNKQDLSFIRNTIRYNHEREKRTLVTACLAVAASALFVAIYVFTAYR